MALKDIIAKISPDNARLFHHDADANRRVTLERLAKNREAFNDPSKRVRGRWFEIGNNQMVAFSPTRPDGQPIVIDGQSVTFWKADEFPGILDAFVEPGMMRVQYRRSDDHKLWKSDCKVEGNRIVWRTVDAFEGDGPGRWRTSADDDVLTFVIEGKVVTTNSSDGSSASETYRF